MRVEQYNSKGRSDLIVNFARRRMVLELKFSPDGKDAEKLPEEAVEQLEAREYGRGNWEVGAFKTCLCVQCSSL